jgi:hypothetical protein
MYPWKGLEKKNSDDILHIQRIQHCSHEKIKICSCFGIVFVNVETID